MVQWASPGRPPQPAGGAEESDSGSFCSAWRGGAQHEEPPVPGTYGRRREQRKREGGEERRKN